MWKKDINYSISLADLANKAIMHLEIGYNIPNGVPAKQLNDFIEYQKDPELKEAVAEADEEIAERLSLSVPTVKHYVHRVLVRLNLKNRKEAARFARLEGLGSAAAGSQQRIKL